MAVSDAVELVDGPPATSGGQPTQPLAAGRPQEGRAAGRRGGGSPQGRAVDATSSLAARGHRGAAQGPGAQAVRGQRALASNGYWAMAHTKAAAAGGGTAARAGAGRPSVCLVSETARAHAGAQD